jgi:alkanesulfonate monooxygenase SsuD/methylene tetrahydromethanopterin reductase-like flavin-dependent oxidoreductase (luciferase family)
VKWSGFKSYPLPVQDPFPVVIGGTKGNAFRRVARQGQGWFAPTTRPDELAPWVDELGKACAEEGRDLSSIEISCMWIPGQGIDSISRYEELGVGRLVIPLAALGEGNPIEAVDKLGDEVIARLQT